MCPTWQIPTIWCLWAEKKCQKKKSKYSPLQAWSQMCVSERLTFSLKYKCVIWSWFSRQITLWPPSTWATWCPEQTILVRGAPDVLADMLEITQIIEAGHCIYTQRLFGLFTVSLYRKMCGAEILPRSCRLWVSVCYRTAARKRQNPLRAYETLKENKKEKKCAPLLPDLWVRPWPVPHPSSQTAVMRGIFNCSTTSGQWGKLEAEQCRPVQVLLSTKWLISL